jgi:hypothetical protein
VPRKEKAARRLVAGGRTYLWRNRHRHRVPDGRGGVHCRQVLSLFPQPAGSGGPLRVEFADGPGRYVPGGFPFGSGDVGFTRGASLNLHEPGAVRALLDEALARGWQPDTPGEVLLDGWILLEGAATRRAGNGTSAES